MRYNVYHWVHSSYASQTIPMIKALRALTGLGLKEAKDVIEAFGTSDKLLLAMPEEAATGCGFFQNENYGWGLEMSVDYVPGNAYLVTQLTREGLVDAHLDRAKKFMANIDGLRKENDDLKELANKLLGIIRQLNYIVEYPDADSVALYQIADELATTYDLRPQRLERSVSYKFD